VRVAARPTSSPFTWRLTVVAPDRAGLLADLAAALALDGLAVRRSSGTTWDGGRLALLSLRVADPANRRLADDDWSDIGGRLREAARGGAGRDVPHVAPRPPVRVRTTPQPGSRTLVTVLAPDAIGLLWSVASWFTAHGANIEAAHVHSEGEDAYGTFLVGGPVDATALMTHLSGRPAAPSLVQSIANLAAGPLRRLSRR
jgi:[protein-PII] uridylyltransferase